MRVILRVEYKGSTATVFSSGDVFWANMEFPNGLGMNQGLKEAIEAAMAKQAA